MAYSYVEYVGTAGGTTGPFAYGSVALLETTTASHEDQLEVYKNGLLLTGTTDYTINEGTKEVTLVVNIFNNELLRISRITKADARYVDYVDSTNVTSELLDLDSNQLFFLVQEGLDIQGDAMIRGSDGQWNARSYRIGNVNAGVFGTDAVNVNQLNAATSGALPATLSGIGTQTYVGDGATTNFTLPLAISTITEDDDVEVYINGLRQRPGTHYSVSAGDLVITPAPAGTDNILIAYGQGVVSAILTANSVFTSALQDDCVTVAKIAQGTNGQVLKTVSGNTAWASVNAADVPDFDTQVRTSSLDQMAAPTAPVSMNSQLITNLPGPVSAGDAARKTYVDTVYSRDVVYTASPVGTGSASSITVNVTAPFTAGQFTIMFPLNNVQGFLTFSGVITSVFTDTTASGVNRPIRVWVPDTDAIGGTNFLLTYKRTGASNNIVQFVCTRGSTDGASGTVPDLVNSGNCPVSILRGLS